MKKIIKLLTLSVLLIGINNMAQAQAPEGQQSQKGRISGTVIRTDNKPVEFATITLLRVTDSSLVKGAIADVEGKYEFEGIPAGKYLVAAVNMGMKKTFSIPFTVNGRPVKVPGLVLTADSRNLKEVNVTAKRPFIEQKADKMVVNVENSIVAAGGTAMEVLQQSPGVQVDKDDNIAMRGKSGVIIMIDGKPTNMSAQDVAQLLKNMPSSNVDQIELITNPSAKYDAAGNAGIINIKLKKNSSYGTNGSVNIGGAQGKLPKLNTGLNLNHRNEHINVYGSYNYNYNGNFEDLLIYRDNMEKSGRIVFDQNSYMDKESNYHGGKAGLDYFINKNHTIGVMTNLGMSNWHGDGRSMTWIGNGEGIDSSLKTKTDNSSKWRQQSYNLNYRGKLDTTGKELNVDLDYSRNTDKRENFLYSAFMDGAGKVYYRGDTTRSLQPSVIEIKTLKIDYTHPLKKEAKLEAGIKLSFVNSDNDSRFDSLKLAQWEYDINRSNHFIYKENVNAAYINYSKQFKKLGIQAGLRAEQTNVEGNSLTLQQVNDTSYLNFFPSVFLSYQASTDHQWGVSYSRRLQRPGYNNLNPFEFYLDRYTKAGGNPNLRPQYSSNFELHHTFKSFLTTAIGYTHTSDMLSRILEPGVDPKTGDTTILVYKYMNVAERDNINLNISAPVPITKWWKSFTNLSVFYNAFETVVSGEQIKRSSGGFYGQTQHTFTVTKSLSAEASFFYMSPQISDEGLFKMKSMYAFNIGFSQQVLKSKGTVKLNVNDVFNTQRFRGDYTTTNRDVSLQTRWDSRQVRASFTYRFGNSNVKEARNRKTGLEDELNRVK